MNIQKAGIGAALPLLLNPATLGFVALGAVGWGIYNLLRDDEDDGCDVPSNTVQKLPAKTRVAKAGATQPSQVSAQAAVQLEAPVKVSDEAEARLKSDETADDAERSLIIRQAMSELGKRSAAARAKRKAAASEGAVDAN
ncbi:MAG: hypothetical protein HRU33_15950 [Rhodobacteraceae bacterium]|nr:hypothetical protein [Paracoccaceae bacterium]